MKDRPPWKILLNFFYRQKGRVLRLSCGFTIQKRRKLLAFAALADHTSPGVVDMDMTPMPEFDQGSDQVARELSLAEEARANGNEGRARVCARRAANIIIGEYQERRGLPDPGMSAIDRLRFLETLPDVSAKAKQTAQYLLMHVTPEYTLPVDVDLIAEARWLEQELLEN